MPSFLLTCWKIWPNMQINLRLAHCLSLLACLFSPLHLAHAGESAVSQPLEAKTIEIAHQLRCLVCQNQSIAESNAELALDLRQQVREKLQQGQTEAEIIRFFLQRYGEVILYKPPFKLSTAFLWLGPFGLLGVGLLLWRRKLRRTQATPTPAMTYEPNAPFTGVRAGQVWQIVGIGAGLMLCAALIYSQLGNPAAIELQAVEAASTPASLALSDEEVQVRVEQIKLLLVMANSKSEQGDHLGAMHAWQKLQSLAAPDSALARIAAENSKQAQTLLSAQK